MTFFLVWFTLGFLAWVHYVRVYKGHIIRTGSGWRTLPELRHLSVVLFLFTFALGPAGFLFTVVCALYLMGLPTDLVGVSPLTRMVPPKPDKDT